MANIKAVIFDLDGTLADTLPDITNSLRKVTGVEIESDVVRRSVGRGVRVLMEKVYAHYGIECRDFDEDVRRYSEVYAEGSGNDSVMNPGALELLDWLHKNNIPAVVATMKPRKATDKFMDFMGIKEHFVFYISGDEMERPKPDGWCVEEACRRLGISPTEALMVGDGMTDVLAGKNAGAKTAAVLGGYFDQQTMKDSGADRVIERLDELIGLEV